MPYLNSLRCRVTPAQGSVKPTEGFHIKLSGSLRDFFDQHKVVAMDDLISNFVSQQIRNLGRTPPGYFQYIRRRIVHQPAPELDAVGIEQAHAITTAEISAHLAHTRRQERAPAVARRVSRALVDRERSRRAKRECDPMLAALEPHPSRHYQRARFSCRVQRSGDDSGFASSRDNHGDTGTRRLPR